MIVPRSPKISLENLFQGVGFPDQFCQIRDQQIKFSRGEFLMNEAEVYIRLTDVFHTVLDDDTIALKPETTAKDVDGWDSLTHIRILLTVEKEFKVKFSTAEIGGFKNVGDLVSLIQSRTE